MAGSPVLEGVNGGGISPLLAVECDPWVAIRHCWLLLLFLNPVFSKDIARVRNRLDGLPEIGCGDGAEIGRGALALMGGFVPQKPVNPDFPNIGRGIPQLCGDAVPERMERNFWGQSQSCFQDREGPTKSTASGLLFRRAEAGNEIRTLWRFPQRQNPSV